MCCGRKRAAQRHPAPAAPAPAAPPTRAGSRPPIRPVAGPSPSGYGGAVLIQYLETAPIRAWGPLTGRVYDFSADKPIQPVDPGDAAALAMSDLFRRF